MVAGVAVLLWVSFFHAVPPSAPPLSPHSAGYDWYLVLHLPETPNDPYQAAVAGRNLHIWLTALKRGGYQPLLFSDAQSRLSRGLGLPQRAVVLVYDPGFHRTFDTVSPILLNHRVPVVWVTNHTAVLRGDRHYMNRREMRRMLQSGYWDIGFSGDGFWSQGTPEERRQVQFNPALRLSWAPETGRQAINWLSALNAVHRLDIGSRWTAEDLLDRLATELPLQGTSRLGLRMIRGRLWGIIIPSAQEASAFSLQTPLTGTSRTLYWLGTQGLQDARLELQASSFFGQFFLWLRSGDNRQDGVGIGFSREEVFLDQRTGSKRHRLAVLPRKPAGNTLQATVTLSGQELQISGPDLPTTTVSLSPAPTTGRGLVRIAVYDHVRGAARAEDVNVILTPLTPLEHR